MAPETRLRSVDCVASLVRTQSLVNNHLARRLRRHGISPAAFQVLSLLRRAPEPLSPHELGEQLMVTRAAVTGLLDSLEERRLVKRSRHPVDRRMLLVGLTAEGVAQFDHLVHDHQTGESEMMGCLAEREREMLARLLSKLQAHLVRLSAE